MKELRQSELEAQLARARSEARDFSEQVVAHNLTIRNLTIEVNELKEIVRRWVHKFLPRIAIDIVKFSYRT